MLKHIKLFNDIHQAWVTGDKDGFRTLVSAALSLRLNENDILQYLTLKKEIRPADEDFEEWAYHFLTSRGQSECTPG